MTTLIHQGERRSTANSEFFAIRNFTRTPGVEHKGRSMESDFTD